MRTTLDLPENLINNAMKITRCKTKTELFKIALENIIRRNQVSKIINYHGKVELNLNIKKMRER